MKRIVATLLLCAVPGTALAADSAGEPPLPPGFYDDFLGPDTVPLTARERRALSLTRDWAGRGPSPVLSQSGKLVYVHGASLPTILASPMQVCDVELQPGEKVNEIIVGDSARWMVESGTSGDTTHLFVKPVDAGLETTAVETTDRRVYHLRLVSQRTGHTPYVGFVYSDAMKKKLTETREARAKERERNALKAAEGRTADVSDLNFNYSLKGRASWKPARVFDDGEKMYIHLPRRLPDMPVLFARNGGEQVLVNYRIDGGNIVVDGVFDELSLVLGVGRSQEEVRIERKGAAHGRSERS